MLILWIRKIKTGMQSSPRKKEPKSFQKHNADMKKFRLSHPDIEAINSQDIITADGNILAPVHGFRLAKNIQN